MAGFEVCRGLNASEATRNLQVRVPILVIDDEEALRHALQRILRHHEGVVADSGATAVTACPQDRRLDLILCDLMMPAMNGMEFHQWLAQSHPDLARRTVFVSGGACTPEASACLAQTDLPILDPFEVAAARRFVDGRLNSGEQD